MRRYCYYCDKDVEYTVKEELIHDNIEGVEYSFVAKLAYCNECGKEIYIAELDDENIRSANAEYKRKAGLAL